jgi:hypothetical protein
MTPEDFVSCIRREILEGNLALYKNSIARSTSGSEPGPQNWPRMAEFYRSLNNEDRQTFMAIVRQIIVDTLSNVLGILDGSTLLEKHRGYFKLTYGDEARKLNGELQDLFLSGES